jgi:hypothetical protein
LLFQSNKIEVQMPPSWQLVAGCSPAGQQLAQRIQALDSFLLFHAQFHPGASLIVPNAHKQRRSRTGKVAIKDRKETKLAELLGSDAKQSGPCWQLL